MITYLSVDASLYTTDSGDIDDSGLAVAQNKAKVLSTQVIIISF